MERAIVMAAAQTVPLRGDVAANVEEHLGLVRSAAREDVRILVFPELSLTGYELDLAPELAFEMEDARLDPLVDSAAAHQMTLVVGAPVRRGARLHIGAFLLFPNRSRALYTKHHLGAFSNSGHEGRVVPPAEATVFEPGDDDPRIQIDGEVLALAVCADTSHPSHPSNAAASGATAYLAGMFITPDLLNAESQQLASYARQHAMTVVMANYGGPSGGLEAGGGSAVWSARGEVLACVGRSGSGLAIGRTVDPG